MNDLVNAAPLSLVERLVPGQSHEETTAMLGRGLLVFVGGMMLAAASFVVEGLIVRTFRAG